MELSQEQIDEDIEELYQELTAFVAQAGGTEQHLRHKGWREEFISPSTRWCSLTVTALFLKEEAKPILDTVSEMLSNAAESIDEVQVLGHTAQANPKRPNNVETDRTLASQRATNVVIYVQSTAKLTRRG